MDDDLMTPMSADAPVLPAAGVDEDDGDFDFDEDKVGVEKNITEDGGVKKTILVAGTGFDKPEKHDVVSVHYVGTLLDGTKFDSSRDRGDPFTFNLGEGSVIKGWDAGVATMKKGEKAVLTCEAAYAYGAQGSPPKIPPNATLQFEVELLSWRSVKDISPAGDGGIIKTILQEGDGYNKPSDRDEVTVHYKVVLSGSTEPVLVSPSEGVELTVAEGLEGLACVPVALKTMKKGEKAKLVVTPEYAFGDSGAEGVPPGSSVEVELEVVSWKKVEDVTDDGLVTKKTLVESDEWKRPNEGAKVTVRLFGKLGDGTVFESHPEGEELTFTTEEGAVCEGLDQAVMKMKQGERCIVTVPPLYGYGQTEHKTQLAVIPPGATLQYDVELVSFENAKESWEMKDPEKVEAATTRKDKGNAAFKAGDIQKAVRAYDKALSYINNDKTFPDEAKAKSKEVKKSCWLNLAACHLKLSHHKEAASNASKVLEADPYNIKALYRRAQAYLGSQDFVEAEEDIKRGLSEEPQNTDLQALSKRLKVAARETKNKEKAIFSKMFAFPSAKKATAAAPAVAAVPEPAAVEEAAAQ